MYRRLALPLAAVALGGTLVACEAAQSSPAPGSTVTPSVAPASSATAAPPAPDSAVHAAGPATPTAAAARPDRVPNELGRIPVFEYHLIGDTTTTWSRERGRFRQDLELMYERGYRPVTMAEVLDKKIDLPAGISPVVIVFDDASPSQFRYVERDGALEVDPRSGLGVWLDFKKGRADWPNKAVFCLLSGAEAGRSFFGNKGIEGQKTEWRFRKVQYLNELGFELCNHTLWHATLSKYSDAVVQEQIARGDMAIDSAVPGYRVRTFALPLGVWPKNRALAASGSWTDPKTKRVVRYQYDAVLEVAGGPTRSPYDPQFNPRSILRIPVIGDAVRKELDQLERAGTAYVSDGDPKTVARKAPAAATAASAPQR
ncbi:MAG TPA: polysaccharide deacetylase family protein [Gemmatimonadaceae bacterium]|jgi:hypothetical protein|nr:polysaccharide deacetylase family protein [Gemmatimonadaceae bacterium]